MDEATRQDAVKYVEAYQRWRSGADERTMEEAGLDPQRISWALAELVKEVKGKRKDLVKCWQKRLEYNREILALRRKLERHGLLDEA